MSASPLHGFFRQLRDRHVIQWTVAYMTGAWMLWEATGQFAEVYGWPDWILPTLTIVLGFGILSAMTIAWFHGDRGWQRVPRREAVLHTLIAGLLIGFLWLHPPVGSARVAAALPSPVEPTGHVRTEPVRVAVLPFKELSGDSTQEYLAVGMTELLTSRLAQVEGLRVISYAAGPVREPDFVLSEVAEELGVPFLVTGSVLRDGVRVQVVAHLVDPSRHEEVWGNTFEGDLVDALPLLSEAARQIAEELQVVLTADEVVRLTTVYRTGPAVMEAVLRARYHLGQGFPENVARARILLEEALDVDPGFAPAWGLLAMVHVARGAWWGGGEPADVVVPLAERAARRALALDPHDPDARTALAEINAFHFRWEAAERDYRAILARDPSRYDVGVHLTNLLTWMGRYDEAEALARRTVEIAPLSPFARNELANVLAESGRTSEVLPHLLRSLELDPSYGVTRALLLAYLVHAGRCEGSGDLLPPELGDVHVLDEIGRLRRQPGPLPANVQSYIISAYLRCDRAKLASDAFTELRERAQTEHVSPAHLARAYSYMGYPEEALGLVKQAIAERDASIRTLTHGSGFRTLRDALRGDPRLEEVLDELGLPR
jgi:TolB-like protein/Tfp pilus assembly protein PilF